MPGLLCGAGSPSAIPQRARGIRSPPTMLTHGLYQRPVTRGNLIQARVPRWRLGRNTLLARALFSLLLYVIYNCIKTEELIAAAVLPCACPSRPWQRCGAGALGPGGLWDRASLRGRAGGSGLLRPPDRTHSGIWGSHSTRAANEACRMESYSV